MSSGPSHAHFPRAPLIGGALLVVSALLLAVYGSANGLARPEPPGKIVAERALRFADRSDGAVVISLADSGRVLDVAQGQNGFLRGFARTRHEDGIGPMPPMTLTGYTDGRLVLFDPSTGRQVDLEAFGSLNTAVFVRLLTMSPQSETASAVPQGGGS